MKAQQIASVIVALFGNAGNLPGRPIPKPAAGTKATHLDLYDMLWLYYLNSGLYDELARLAFEAGLEVAAIKGLRTPAKRLVEFYVATTWPGDLPEALEITWDPSAPETYAIEATEAVHRVWDWSNWTVNKQLGVRTCAITGDMFLSVVEGDDKVYYELIDPRHVPSFELDSRGYVTMIRIDTPQDAAPERGFVEPFVHTVVWEKSGGDVDAVTGRQDGRYRVWEHNREPFDTLDKLGTPVIDEPLSAFGIDYIPIVHAKFNDLGEDRGVGAYTLDLDKVDEINRLVTRLHQLLWRYNKAVWALQSNSLSKDGRPMPPPMIGAPGAGIPAAEANKLELGDDEMLSLPGMATLESLIPQLDYKAMIEEIQAATEDLEADRPELAWRRLRESTTEVSGRAVRLLLSDAVAKVLEVRGNLERALARADAIALSLGNLAGLWSVGAPGDYEAGLLRHRFQVRPVIYVSDLEQAETALAQANAAKAKQEVSDPTFLGEMGYTVEEVATILAEREKRAQLETDRQRALLDGGILTGFEDEDDEEAVA